MTHKTKVIIVSVIGTIIAIPIVVIALAFVFLTLTRTSASKVVGSSGSIVQNSLRQAEMFGSATKTNDIDMVVAPEMALPDSEMPISIIATAGETAAEVDQKIIKTGYLDLMVDAVDETASKTSALASGKGGYTQSSSISERENGSKYGTIIIRIPAAEFENTMTEIKKFAVAINTESLSGQDVTEQYTDLEAQLRNAQAQEAEYLNILKKATTVDDILNVQSYLGQVRQQIESLQGRIKYLSNLTSYSTITVSLSEEPAINLPTKEFRPWTSVKEAARALVSVAQTLVITLIWLVVLGGGIFLPIIIVFAIAILVIRKIWHRIYKKN